MRFFLLAPVLAAAALIYAPAADACGACFHNPSDTRTQVAAHNMVLSISTTETTLWDQIEYAGEPESFAWVLPIKGTVEVGVSSDLLMQTLWDLTSITIFPTSTFTCPPDPCAPPPTGVGSGTSTGVDTGVQVLAQETVGPYETVQLSASEPGALGAWLSGHGYAVPPEIQPLIDAYVSEGFNFLAMKLVPGAGIDAMRPVRVSTPGAFTTLPLRMVAAGTGYSTPVRLYVVGEGRYEAANFPNLLIDRDAVKFSPGSNTTNYSALRKEAFVESGGLGWLTSSSMPDMASTFENTVLFTARVSPAESGYGDGDPLLAVQEAETDLQKLYGHFPESSFRLTRLDAELQREAFENDLLLKASADQGTLSTQFGAAWDLSSCPDVPDASECAGVGGSGGGPASNGWGGDPTTPGTWSSNADDGGCAASQSSAPLWPLGVLAVGAAAGLRRRRRD